MRFLSFLLSTVQESQAKHSELSLGLAEGVHPAAGCTMLFNSLTEIFYYLYHNEIFLTKMRTIKSYCTDINDVQGFGFSS